MLRPFADAANIAFSDNKEFNPKFWEDSARSASILLSYPQKANDLTFNLLDAMEQGEGSWRDLLNRRTKK